MMKMINDKSLFLILLSMFIVAGLSAKEILDLAPMPQEVSGNTAEDNLGKTTSNCAAATAFTDLDINNVRARIMNGGDMWWDRGSSTARYEVPKGSLKNSLFAGSVWIGGFDIGGNLRVSAQTYRQTGNDYFPGPLDNSTASIPQDRCERWDRIWKVNNATILEFIREFANDPNFDFYSSEWDAIREWPGFRNTNGGFISDDFTNKTTEDFAPFVDINGNGIYEPESGEYPEIKGDQYLWWIFNDNGNNKTETNTPSIGMEVHASAFAFLTNDDLNNATFYRYKLINRSTNELDSCTISTWTDADLGYFRDDYVGCDTSRDLGILYNGDAFDGFGQPTEYGADIPMIAIDFFEGPIDENNEELGMTSFVFYNNDGSANLGNPRGGIEFYRYMTGSLRNGSPYTTTCNAVDAGGDPTTTVYWGDPSGSSDITTNWNECGCGNPAADRRFVHSSGPFKLTPGDDPIDVTIGAVWATGFNYPCPSFAKINVADDKAQELFDRDFIPVQPPNAPILTIRELDEKLVLYLNNPEGSNNYNLSYGTDFKEISVKGINLGYTDEECTYMFEGYKIFQVADSTVTTSDLYNADGSVNTDKARLAFQCDVKNGVSSISNFIYDVEAQTSTPYFRRVLAVEGADDGIRKSFVATSDLFSTGTSSKLVNYKRYYYIAVAYAYNEFAPFDPTRPDQGQEIAYLESFKNGFQGQISAVEGIPNSAYTSMGNQIRADYGDGVNIRVLEGKGNGGNYLVMTKESENEALANGQATNLCYEKGKGPIDVRIVDPVKVPSADFEIWLEGTNSPAGAIDTSRGLDAKTATWKLINKTTGEVILAESNLDNASEQIFADYGLTVEVNQVPRVGDDVDFMGLIGDTIIYAEPTLAWLSGVSDMDSRSAFNWIRSGTDANPVFTNDPNYIPCETRDFSRDRDAGPWVDPYQQLEVIQDGTWSPYALVSNDPKGYCSAALAYEGSVNYAVGTGSGYFSLSAPTASRLNVLLSKVNGVEIVLTPDRSKWSKCAVVEMRAPNRYSNNGVVTPNGETYSEGGANIFDLRRHASLMRDPDANGGLQYDLADYGSSWFPGYAINVETGERLNIFFGEDSYQPQNGGTDMVWNPGNESSEMLGALNPISLINESLFGGKHMIYVSRTKYDGCDQIIADLKNDESFTNWVSQVKKRNLYSDVIWAGFPLVKQGSRLTTWSDGLIPTETRIQIRTTLPYQEYTDNPGFDIQNNGLPRYFFSTKDQTMVAWSELAEKDVDAQLDRIRVVPNPYYAYSAYEWNRLDNRVKIINLPPNSTVKIYSLDGVLIRTLTKSDNTSFIDWDLKNNVGISVSGGAYIMHVQAEGIGETVLKWFGAIRPTDITTY